MSQIDTLSFQLPHEQAERLREAAKLEDRSLASLLRRGVAAVLSQLEAEG